MSAVTEKLLSLLRQAAADEESVMLLPHEVVLLVERVALLNRTIETLVKGSTRVTDYMAHRLLIRLCEFGGSNLPLNRAEVQAALEAALEDAKTMEEAHEVAK